MVAQQAEPDKTRVVVIDNHETFARLLLGALNREADLAGVGHAKGMESGVELCRDLCPDVVIVDYHLDDGDGLATAERLLAEAPATRIVMLTGDPSPEILNRAAALGVCAFVLKDGSLSALLEALRQAKLGSMIRPPCWSGPQT